MRKATPKAHRLILLVLFFVTGLSCAWAQADTSLYVHTEELDTLYLDEEMTLEEDSVPEIQEPENTLTFDLLTCSPGPEVYELYGHTALRVTDSNGMDVVFNYGVFDFNKPHFVWNFVLGKTDYMVYPIPYSLFIREYEERGSSVTSQRLNLTREESERLMHALTTNVQPQNREYRYNFLTNNCTTKVRDIVERAIDGEVTYREATKYTYRECLHVYTAGHPWAEVGDDMLLGASVDTILTDRRSAFLPERLMDFYNGALIYDVEGNSRPLLVGEPVVLLAKRDVPVEPEFPLSPWMVILCFAGLSLLVLACEMGFKRMIWGYDMLLMTALGLSGVLIWFMLLFSEHPSVDTNWQAWLFNPLPLICMPWVVWKAIKRQFCLYHLANFACLVLFLAFSPWIPQHFALTTIPLACTLLTRPLSYYFYYTRVMEKTVKQGADTVKPKAKERKKPQ